MNEKEFMETMSALITAAAANENRVTEAEVQDAFAQMALSEEQFQMIRQYLKASRVTVVDEDAEGSDLPGAEELLGGFEADAIDFRESSGPADTRESPEEAALFEEYKSMVLLLKPLTEAEVASLTEALLAEKSTEAQKTQARNRLAEHFLPLTVRLAESYGSKGVTRNDLAQEGSLVLLQALIAYDGGQGSSLEAYLEKEIRKALAALLEEQEGQNSIGEKITSRANRLMELSAELAKDLGREATPAELSEKLGVSEEEIRDIMKLSLDAMSVLEAQGGPIQENLSEGHEF